MRRFSSSLTCSLVLPLLVATACGGGSAGIEQPPTETPPNETSPPATNTTTTPTPDGSEILQSDSGKLRGVRGDGLIVWKGIPYAAPPTGQNRWREPQPVTPWNDVVRDAVKFGAECVQTAPDTSASTGGSEDCLTLNVWRPDKPMPPGGWPVMFYMHGGYNVRGSSSHEIEPGIPSYDGKKLAQRDVIYVSINYRLGALGWMGHTALAAESTHHASGNYGTLDQIAALRWVEKNAAALGADPKRVLVFGQSAGATNTCGLIASPLAAGLFSRAVMHSGACAGMQPGRAEQAGAAIAEALGCAAPSADVLACLRAKPAAEVASAKTLDFTAGGFAWGHSVDGWVFPSSIATRITTGTHNHVPIVVGVTAHEMTTLWRTAYPQIPIPTTPAQHEDALRSIFGAGPRADAIVAQYPASAYSTPAVASVAALTDANFVCPARAVSRVLSRVQGEPVRRFYFSHALANGPARAYGAGHGFDMLFVFAPEKVTWFQPTPSESALSDSIIGYLTRFAATGDPNGAGAVAWPPYDATQDSHLILNDTIRVGTKLREAECDFWASL